MPRIAPSIADRGARLPVRLLGLLLVFCSGTVASTAVAIAPNATASTPANADTPVATAPESPEAALLACPTTRDHVGRVVVPVTINGRGPFRFIVDTGANHSTISAGLVRTLGLQPTEATPIVLDGITGSALVSFVTVDQLQAGELMLENESLPVVSAPVMGGADGILGAAGLTTKSLMVDFQHNRVAISRSVASPVRAQALKIHALRLTHGLITLAALVGGVRVQAVVDTGSERTLANLALRNALHARERPGAVVQLTSVYGATAEIEAGEIRRAPPISVESVRINDAVIVYGDFHIFKVWGLADKPAMIIGMDVLGTLSALGIDFERQDVYITGVRANNGSSTFATMHGYMSEPAMKR